jgi:hypothetical protein
MKRLWSARPRDVLAFSVIRLGSSANAAGVRSANALYGISAPDTRKFGRCAFGPTGTTSLPHFPRAIVRERIVQMIC